MVEEMLLGSYLDELDRALLRASRIAEARMAGALPVKRRGFGRVLTGRFGNRAAIDERFAA